MGIKDGGMSLEGQRVVVIGGASGIGFATHSTRKEKTGTRPDWIRPSTQRAHGLLSIWHDGFLIVGEGAPPRDQIVTNLNNQDEIGSIYLSPRARTGSRANRAGDRPIVLVKAVLNALADP